MTYKITVHTELGDVRIGDQCETGAGRRGTLAGIDSGREFSYQVAVDGEPLWTKSIRPIQKPKPLEGMELAEKLGELFRSGWWSSTIIAKEHHECAFPYIAVIRREEDIFIKVGVSDVSHICIRAPRSTEWIRACEVTEETGM